MYSFHCSVHVRPAEGLETGMFARSGKSLPALIVPPSATGVPFALTFEAAGAALGKLERMYFEPDGSFVWVSANPAEPWQVDGVLYDRHERLLYLELKGECPSHEFDRLLAACGWPATPLMFQLVREAVFLDELEFRRWAEGNEK
jgi:hypothetical protein